ncbi:MAG TPA: PA2779 family protein [Gallionellaceae bacterium]
MKKSLMSFSSRVLMVSMLSMSVWMPSAQAGMVSSEQVIASQAAQQNRARLQALFARQDVREQLQARGVDADAARARVDALTDEEVASINGQIDSLPAGGDIVGAVVFVFLVLLVTDLLGLTKVFPFTHPIRR